MALATQCPHCGKRFRVAADQLKLRGGIVRCGACHEIFDGNATLIDLDALAAKQAASAQPASVPEPAPALAPTHPSAPALAPAPALATTPSTVVPAQAGTQADVESPEPDSQPAASVIAPPPPAITADTDASPAAPEPIYTLDFDHTFDPFGILPKPAVADEVEPGGAIEAASSHAPADAGESAGEPPPTEATEPLAHATPEPAQQPAAATAEPARPAPDDFARSVAEARRVEPTLGLPVDEELVAAALPEHDDFDPHEATAPRAGAYAAGAPLPMRESAPGDPLPTQSRPPLRSKTAEARAAARRSKLTPTKIAAPKLRAPEIDEPEFVRRSRQQEQSGKTRRILLSAGSVLLLLLLAGQSALSFRNVLAARYPGAKPALVSACALFGCRVELPARIDNLAIEQGELTALGANAYSLATLLHNQANLAHAWPHIELTLTDANDKPLVRRVFTPAEYLPQGTRPDAGFAARAEQAVRLTFQLDQLKPSGYRIAIFYP
jgi:predicted Zn finger-like uncharacterized protein